MLSRTACGALQRTLVRLHPMQPSPLARILIVAAHVIEAETIDKCICQLQAGSAAFCEWSSGLLAGMCSGTGLGQTTNQNPEQSRCEW